MFDASGAITDTYTYDAYGSLIASTGSTTNAYLYRGEQWDSAVGLLYLRARWYSPVSGRFISADEFEGEASEPASLTKFGYADADPVTYRDPSGYSASDRAITLQTTLRNSALRLTRSARSITLDQVESSSEIAWDAVCCLDKAWSALAIASASPEALLAIRALDIICKIGCPALRPGFNAGRPGRFGGFGHRGEVINIITDLTLEGFEILIEQQVGGRFVDVVGYHPGTGNSVFYQVGRRNRGGSPVCRERRALEDIIRGGALPTFRGY